MEAFLVLNPVLQAFFAGLFTWGVTALGAGAVFLTRTVERRLLDTMLGFASGVMIAASFWSLLAPAIDYAEEQGNGPSWFPAVVGFLLGGLFLYGMDKLLPHLHPSLADVDTAEPEGLKTTWRRSILLVSAVTLHNIPEGLAVGVAFGAAARTGNPAAALAGVTLAIGIGLQNFPEGMAVAMPLRGQGLSRWMAFLYGQASGIVEPISAVLGAAAVLLISPLLPYALAFAAGAMIFVVVEELIPDSHCCGNGDIATMGTMIGFSVMMLMDVALG